MRCIPPKPLLSLLLLAALGSCWDQGAGAEPLTIDRTSPPLGDPSQPVLLNDALTVYFSEPLQPLSVTSDSVSLLDEDGHHVPGELQVGSNWVAFVPEPPLAKDLTDGSFRPGGRYSLQLSGGPRVDRIRSEQDRWLDSVVSYDVFVAERNQVPNGLPAILRPPASDLPFMLRLSEAPLKKVAADAPRLQLHFTLPVLPSSVSRDSLRIQLHDPPEVLVPRSVRVVASPLDNYPGSTIEIDLGAIPEREDGTSRALRKDDWIHVTVRANGGLVDYAGNPPLPTTAPQFWSVVAGRSVPICEWPAHGPVDQSAGDRGAGKDDDLHAGFEMHGSTMRPRVRVEAGNGSLGAFRPTGDMTLRAGQTFDPGDGRVVASTGSTFAFTSLHIPAGVTISIDAQDGPVQVLATGGMRIDGKLRLLGPPTLLPPGRYTQPVRELVTASRISLVAAGDIHVAGVIETDAIVAESQTPLLLATASTLRLQGTLPFQTILVAEARDGDTASRIVGARGQSRPYLASFTEGPAPGSDFTVEGVLPWRQLPQHLDSGLLKFAERTGDLTISWQATPADAIRGDYPDLTAGRIGRWRVARDETVVVAGIGGFVRIRLRCRVRDERPFASLRELRLVEN